MPWACTAAFMPPQLCQEAPMDTRSGGKRFRKLEGHSGGLAGLFVSTASSSSEILIHVKKSLTLEMRLFQ